MIKKVSKNNQSAFWKEFNLKSYKRFLTFSFLSLPLSISFSLCDFLIVYNLDVIKNCTNFNTKYILFFISKNSCNF